MSRLQRLNQEKWKYSRKLRRFAETRKTRTVPVVTKNAELDLGDARVLRQHTLEDISHALYALCMAQPTLPAALASKPPVML